MERASLPKYYNVKPAQVVDNFSTGWAATTGDLQVALDSTYTLSGTALKCTATASQSTAYKNGTWNFAGDETIGVWVYFPSRAASASPAAVQAKLMLFVTGLTKYFDLNFGGVPYEGWVLMGARKEDFNRVGGAVVEDFASIAQMRVRCTASASYPQSLWFDSIVKNWRARPKILISIDDGNSNVMTYWYPKLAALGLTATCYINSGTIGTAGKMTLADLNTLQNAGWLIANHSTVHTNATDAGATQYAANVRACGDWLEANGFRKGARHHAYVGGVVNAAVQSDLASYLTTGRLVQGNKIPIIQCGHPSAQAQLSIDKQHFHCIDLSSLNTEQQFKDFIDSVCAKGGLGYIYGHDITTGASTSTTINETTFDNVMAHLKRRINEGLVDVTNIADYEAGIHGAR